LLTLVALYTYYSNWMPCFPRETLLDEFLPAVFVIFHIYAKKSSNRFHADAVYKLVSVCLSSGKLILSQKCIFSTLRSLIKLYVAIMRRALSLFCYKFWCFILHSASLLAFQHYTASLILPPIQILVGRRIFIPNFLILLWNENTYLFIRAPWI